MDDRIRQPIHHEKELETRHESAGWKEAGNGTGMRKRQGDIMKRDGDGYIDIDSNLRAGGSGHAQRRAPTKKTFLQRARSGFFPIIFGIAVGWYFDAIEVLVLRRDPRIKGNLLTFSLLCWLVMLSIFFYLQLLRPLILKKPTHYVSWESEFRLPIQIATVCLVVGTICSNIALWPVWHLSTFLVMGSLAVATIKFLGLFF